MIRFACGTCGKSLRAPETMAGRKGRCARCAAVNMVPVAEVDVLAVEVKRATTPSPFRNADESVRGTIQATVAIGQARVLSDAPITQGGGPPGDFFDHVASRLMEFGEPFAADRAAPGQNRARIEIDDEMPVELPPARRGAEAAPVPAEPRSAVAMALAVGVGIGFCLGIVVAKWWF